ncbi:UNVERIFIED_CONTAM: hypothetical protein ITH36_25045, partial [Salmonella enterica subsp. enterica serovar Weltevreden]
MNQLRQQIRHLRETEEDFYIFRLFETEEEMADRDNTSVNNGEHKSDNEEGVEHEREAIVVPTKTLQDYFAPRANELHPAIIKPG